ncbi:hypothetical protein F2Q68_00014862 [Brassica cretica]|uniref:Uncharacterized protein n=1 Tax=Brassica cretica TaxID=69181 RepID=A0A8S9HER8_BRACR|nr:hypothetical protein F2Q68_00014862 [Brassica cretica]
MTMRSTGKSPVVLYFKAISAESELLLPVRHVTYVVLSDYLCCGEVTKGISKSICSEEESCSYKRAVLSVVEKTLDMMIYQKSSSLSKEPRGRKTPGSEDPTPNPNRFQIVRSAVVTQVREIRALRLRRSVGEKRPRLKGEQPEEPTSPLMVPSSAVSLHQIRHNSSRSR